MVTLDRQEIIATNKSLRLIKNELEHLLDKGVVTDEVFDQVTALLPAESSLPRATPSNAASPTPPAPVSAPQSPPVQAMANMGLHNNHNQPQAQRQNPHQPPSQNPTPVPSANSPAPPAYNQTGPPSLPVRGGPPAAPPPSKPVLAHARALYRYQAADERDLSFERDDRIAVHEYMNADWWMGRNERTGAEGIFPKNYVHVDQDYKQQEQQQKQQPYGMPPPQHYQPPYGNPGYPAPPPGQNPYNAHVPPMAVAQGGDGGGGGGGQGAGAQEGGSEGGNSKINEHGKKFGKKLGNAAIFGAGATMGSNLVNSIF